MSDSRKKNSKGKKKATIEERIASTPLVCVTGANGFLGAHVVRELLERGYEVRGTVRSLEDSTKTDSLRKLQHAKKRLQLVQAVMDRDDAFDLAFEGCDYVIHTASPYLHRFKDAQKDLVDPAVIGSLAAMNGALKNGVKKIVVTSSVTAVTDEPDPNIVYNEGDWNVLSSLKRNAYPFSKTVAERACWNFVDEHQDDPKCPKLITILPSGISGPSIGQSGLANPSNGIFKQLLDGEMPFIISLHPSFVDVRDVAVAHVLAIENEEASGRYICTANQDIWLADIAAKLRETYPQAKVPTRRMDGRNMTCLLRSVMRMSRDPQMFMASCFVGRKQNFDTSKIQRDLGIVFRDVMPGIFELVEQMIGAGMIKCVPQSVAVEETLERQ